MKFFLILLLSLIMIGCKHFGIVNVIPPVDMTQSAITETFVRIDIYAIAHSSIALTRMV